MQHNTSFYLENKNSAIDNMQKDLQNYLSTQTMKAEDFKFRIYEWSKPTISLGIRRPSLFLIKRNFKRTVLTSSSAQRVEKRYYIIKK